MRTCLRIISTVCFLLVFLTGSVIGCSNGNTESGKVVIDKSRSARLVNALSQAGTEKETKEAIEAVLTSSLTLGLLDEDGKQLNPNVSPDAVSLSTFAVSSYTQMGMNGSYRTIEYVVDFLADGGIQLESTGGTITVKDFLPDLQAYVERSFNRPDDPESALGIMIASGPDMTMPDTPPILTADSTVSPFVSLLIAADIILGTGNGNDARSTGSVSLFAKKVVAAPNEEAVQQIRGLITKVKNYSILTDLLPERAQQLLAAFEVCDRLSVRMWEIPDTMQASTKWDHTIVKTLPIAREFTLEKGKNESVSILGGVAVMNGVSSVPETIEGVETSYRFHLVSHDEQGTGIPLFTDADAVLAAYSITANCTYSPDLNGHRLRVSCKGNVPFILSAKTINNETPRRGLLHASALISAPENLYEMAVQKLKDKLGGNAIIGGLATIALDQLPWDEIKQTMVLLNRDFQPTPWMCTVDFTPVEKEMTETEKPEEKPEPGPPVIKITSPSSGMTFSEEEEIILTVEAFDDAGNPISESYINDRVKWTYDGGIPLACAALSGGDFKVNTKLSRAAHTITVSIMYNRLEDTDTIELTVVPEEYTLLETLLKKEWSLYLRDDPSSNWVKFEEGGTFFFRNDGWKTSWILSGSSITMEMQWDYKSGPDMIQHVKLTGSIMESPDGYYANATMQGEYEEWGDWDKDRTYKTGTWRAE